MDKLKQSFLAGDEIYTQYQDDVGDDIITGTLTFDGSTQKWTSFTIDESLVSSGLISG